MAQLSEDDLQQALEACAAEPVHIPGLVQPFACVLAGDPETRELCYLSENCEDFLGMRLDTLRGMNMRDILGREIWHEVAGAISIARDNNAPVSIGTHAYGGRQLSFNVFSAGDDIGVEIEDLAQHALENIDTLKTLRFLTRQLQASRGTDSLFRTTSELMRHVTGYDRVLIYKFDEHFNGEVLAEARNRNIESFLGLRFPHWDIPEQARAIMAQIPLRFIQDVEQEPVPLLANGDGLPPLDMTFAVSRGVSPVHMQYLRNMGLRATMTLTVMQGDKLWGIISFHHRKPRVPAPGIREVLVGFADLLAFKLQTLEQEAQLDLVTRVDALKSGVLRNIDADMSLEDSFGPIAEAVMSLMPSHGVALLDGSRTLSQGQAPGQAVLHRIIEGLPEDGGPLRVDNLSAMFPALVADLNGCAGVLAVPLDSHRVFCIFREETARDVNWAGNPEKTVESVGGITRLAPRGSFSTYLEEMNGYCAPWSDQDLYFARQIWDIVNVAERRALMNTLSRQQKLMINELNHRVRNILALVRSVSRQARRRYGSLNSYAKSLETRIQSLAAAHDLASGGRVSSVGLKQLVAQEMSPYARDGNSEVTGEDRSLRADIAPVFSLVIHELVTNANKYGALSVDEGKVTIAIEAAAGGTRLLWTESGGPPVTYPEERGFGTVLIQQAVPHEIGGRASLAFNPEGVVAEFFIPDQAFDLGNDAASIVGRETTDADHDAIPGPVDLSAIDGVFLVLEDNFVIADEMREQLRDFGAGEVDVVSNATDALDFLEYDTPVFALLDVNLGNNQTSEPVALRLKALGVPFVFVTGYGEAVVLPDALADARAYAKPLSNADLQTILNIF